MLDKEGKQRKARLRNENTYKTISNIFSSCYEEIIHATQFKKASTMKILKQNRKINLQNKHKIRQFT